MHDPFQNYASLGSYYGMPTPIGLPYLAALQASTMGVPSIPQTGGIQQTGQQGYAQQPWQQQPYGQAQLYGQQPFGQNPGLDFNGPHQHLASALSSLGLQHPLLASLLSNPLIAAGLHPPALGSYMGPQLGLQPNSQIGQIGSQFGQAPYSAPQNWVGQGGLFGGGQGFGAIHPLLSQLAARPFQAPGFSPWGY